MFKIKTLTATNLISVSILVSMLAGRAIAQDITSDHDPDFRSSNLQNGTYQSQIWSSGSFISGTTTFVSGRGGEIGGRYTMKERDRVVEGSLSNCKKMQSRKMRCVWNDPYGTGNLEITFSANFTNFEGYWGEGQSQPSFVWVGSR
jgi:hypothetical protein